MTVIEIQLSDRAVRRRRDAASATDTSAGAAADQRIDDVAAVELAERHQVQRRRQHAPPGGERHRVERHVVAGRNRAEVQPRRRFVEQRLAEVDHLAVGFTGTTSATG